MSLENMATGAGAETTGAGGLLRPPGASGADAEAAGFWHGASIGELRVQACGACGRLRFPPRPLCPWCRSFERTWEPVSGKGEIWSYVVPHPPLLPAYAALAPYNVVVVALAEDPAIRMVGNLVAGPGAEINSVDPVGIRIGQKVEVTFRDAAGFTMPAWMPAPGAG